MKKYSEIFKLSFNFNFLIFQIKMVILKAVFILFAFNLNVNAYTSEKYKEFIVTSGYTDYEKEDALDTLYNYGMDDNAGNLIGLSISWKDLVAKLVHKIGSQNIKAKQKVIKIKKAFIIY